MEIPIRRNPTATQSGSIPYAFAAKGFGYKGSTIDMCKEPPGKSAGYSAIPFSFGFASPSSYPDYKKFSIDHTIISLKGFDEPFAAFRDSSDLWAFPWSDYKKNGFGTAVDSWGFDSWKAAGEDNHATSYTTIPKFSEILIARHERPVDFEIENPAYQKHVTDVLRYDGPINEFGKRYHQASILGQDLRFFEQSKIGRELAYLDFGSDAIERLGVAVKEGNIYSIGRLRDRKIALLRGDKAGEYLAQEADWNFVPIEYMLGKGLGEEIMHKKRGSYDMDLRSITDRVAEEIATKSELLSLYKGLAERTRDPHTKIMYERIVRALEHDIETTEERYTDYHKNISSVKSANQRDANSKTDEKTLDEIVADIETENTAKKPTGKTDADYKSIRNDYDKKPSKDAANDNIAQDDAAEEAMDSEMSEAA